MGRQAGYRSPATRIRSLKRAINYFKYKGIANRRTIPELVHDTCAQVDIPPSLSPVLSISILPSLSISPNPPKHPPTPLPRLPSVSKPSSISSQPTYLTLDLARQMHHDANQLSLQNKLQPSPDLMKCSKCEKIFGTRDDIKWHEESKYGKEDCVILQKMMLSTYFSLPVI